MFRSFSGMRGLRASARADRRPRASSERLGSRLRLESLEDRRLLAITPIGEFDVVTGATVTAPEIAYNAAGDFVVVWRASDAEGDGDGVGILAQVFDADGVAQSPQVVVNTTTAGDQTNHSVAMDADGDFVVAWESGEIMAQRFDRTGVKIGGEITVNSYTDLNQKNPSVGSDAAGNFTVVWDSSGGPDPTGTGHNGGIFGRQFAPDGSPLGGEFRVDVLNVSGNASLYAKLAMNASGEFAVVWLPLPPAEAAPMQWFHADGTRTGGTATIIFSGSISTFSPLLLEMDASGRALVGIKTGFGFGLGQLFSSSGIGQGPLIYRSTGMDSTAMDSSGNLVWIGATGTSGHLYYENLFETAPAPVPLDMTRIRAALGDNGRIAVVGIVNAFDQPTAIHVKRFVVEAPLKVASVTTKEGELLNITPSSQFDTNLPPRDPEPARRPLDQLIVNFSGPASTVDGSDGFHSVTNRDNWQLLRNGVDISSEIDTITYADNRAIIDLRHVLPAGEYQLLAYDSIEGVDGEALDGNADGVAGGQYSTAFEVGPIQLAGPETIVGPGRTVKAAPYPDGNFVLVWNDNGNATKAQRYDAQGASIGPIIEVGANNHFQMLDVKTDNQGRFIVLRRTAGGLVVRRFDADGQPLSGDEVVADATTSGAGLGVDAAGNFAVIWKDSGGVKLQRFNSLGQTQGPQELIDSETSPVVVAIAMNDAGALAISWLQIADVVQHVRAYAADGSPSSNVIDFSPSSGFDQIGTPILMDEEGNFVVSWLKTGGARAQRFDASGSPLSGEILVGNTSPVTKTALALDPQGGLVATWYDEDFYPSTYDDPALYTQRVLFTGEKIGKPLRVTSAADPFSTFFDFADAGLVVFQSFLFGVTRPTVGFQRIVATPPAAAVVDRRVFYNQSAFDGDDPGSGMEDDGAIAPDKVALLPGQTASLANYTSYWLGINGVMIDLAGMHGDISLDDFSFRMGNNSDPSSWVDAPLPSQITVRAGAGVSGSDRIELIWGNGVKNQWLEVTLAANANTGLDEPDVFYFGNAVGESGNSASDARVNVSDQLAARNNPASNAPITSRFDYNRDGQVNITDELLARNNPTGAGNALRLIDLGAPVLVTAASGAARPTTATTTGTIPSALALSAVTTFDASAQPVPARRMEVPVAPAAAATPSRAARVDAALSLVVQDSAKVERLAQGFDALLPDDDWLAWVG